MRETKQGHTPPPWRWRKFGTTWHLVRDVGDRPVVLSTVEANRRWDGDDPADIVLAVRDANGKLVPLTPDHPDARLIEQAPALLAACKAALPYLETGEIEGDDGVTLAPMARAAIAQAETTD